MKVKEFGVQQRIEEIRRALEVDMPISALSLALTIPDICGKIENLAENDKANFIAWFDKYITPQYLPQQYIDNNDDLQLSKKRAMTGTRCYGLRCAVLHTGNEDIEEKHQDPINEVGDKQCFTVKLINDPENEVVYSTLHHDTNIVEVEFYLNFQKFCERICKAAELTLQNYPHESDLYCMRLYRYES